MALDQTVPARGRRGVCTAAVRALVETVGRCVGTRKRRRQGVIHVRRRWRRRSRDGKGNMRRGRRIHGALVLLMGNEGVRMWVILLLLLDGVLLLEVELA